MQTVRASLLFLALLTEGAFPQAGVPASAWVGLAFRPMAQVSASLVIDDVFPDAPAERAGLAAGDQMIRVGRHDTNKEILAAMANLSVGDTMTITVIRGGTRLNAHLRAVERPSFASVRTDRSATVDLDTLRNLVRTYLDAARRRITVVAPPGFVIDQTDSAVVLRNGKVRLRLDSLLARSRTLPPGGSVTDTTSNAPLRLLRGVPVQVGTMTLVAIPSSAGDSVAGVLVAGIGAENRFARAGIASRDVIVRVDTMSIRSVDDFKRAIAAGAGRDLFLMVRRDSRLLRLTIPREDTGAR